MAIFFEKFSTCGLLVLNLLVELVGMIEYHVEMLCRTFIQVVGIDIEVYIISYVKLFIGLRRF